MIGYYFFRWLVGATIWLCSFTALAHSTSRELYEDAVRAIETNQLDEAVAQLEAVLVQQPEHAGAWLDLALVLCQQGDAMRAERLFQHIEMNFSPPPVLRELISKYRESGCQRPRAAMKWRLAAQTGYDNNVNMGARQSSIQVGSGENAINLELHRDYLPHADHFSGVEFDLNYPIESSGDSFSFYAQNRSYHRLHEYSSNIAAIGYVRTANIARWEIQGGGVIGYLSLGGKTYQTSAGVQWLIQAPSLLPDKNFTLSWAGDATRFAFPSQSSYNMMRGDSHVIASWQPAAQMLWKGKLGIILDQTLGNRPGGNRTGWSWQTEIYYKPHPAWQVEANFRRQRLHDSQPYLPGLFDQVRNQRQQQIMLAVSWSLNKAHRLRAEWRALNNNDNIALYRYRGQSYSLNWIWEGQH